jgi:hypothetical protein
MVQQVGPDSATSLALDGIISSLNARAVGMHHINPRIQQDLDLWQRIKDFDKRSAEIPFVPILSKKRKQMLKKHKFDRKLPYRTRSTGASSPSAQ